MARQSILIALFSLVSVFCFSQVALTANTEYLRVEDKYYRLEGDVSTSSVLDIVKFASELLGKFGSPSDSKVKELDRMRKFFVKLNRDLERGDVTADQYVIMMDKARRMQL